MANANRAFKPYNIEGVKVRKSEIKENHLKLREKLIGSGVLATIFRQLEANAGMLS